MKLFLASSLQHTGKQIANTLIADGIRGKVMFLTTASEAEKEDLSWLDDDKQPLLNAGLDVVDYSVTNKKPAEVKESLESVTAVCVAGGNTYYLLDQVRKSGFDNIVTKRVKEGMPYIGSSAGVILTGPNIETSLDDPSITPELSDYTGLNLCSMPIRPHWGSKIFAQQYQQQFTRLYQLNTSMLLLSEHEYVVANEHGIVLFSI